MSNLACSAGDNCVDHYLSPVDKHFLGGNAVNVAVALQRAGCQTSYVGFVGNDNDGTRMIKGLRDEGVDVSHVQVLSGNTAFTKVRLNSSGDREFIHEDLGPVNDFNLTPDDILFILSHRLVHNTWLGKTENFLRDFKQAGNVIVSLDYGERSSMKYIEETISCVDISFFSVPENEYREAEDLVKRMYEKGPKMVIATAGSQGSYCFNGSIIFEPAVPVDVVDTLGAGDSYIGTFLAHFLKGKNIHTCMKNASLAAAKTCTQFGAW